ncbi:hypothetical protein MLD38_009747 [Melastoma candidum]|uniref:Uncharacterized protein n=1 Tax=Melastoma candidum TaxID=119954 RepID=A0ACB9RXY9_9MYRT|nr:hypothetical protein MLD38_009747 [Melastoma candidum]
MEVKDVLFMRRGVGASSYSRTSTFIQKIALLTRPVVTSAVRSLLLEQAFPSSGLFNVADLGCATGPSTFVFMSTVIDAESSCCEGAGSKESSYTWEFLAKAIESLVSEGEVSKEKLDTLNVPYYTASPEEVRSIVEAEGSFAVESMETLVLEAGGGSGGDDPWERGRKSADQLRSFTGSIIAHHFGEEIMDRLYGVKLAHLLGDDFANGGQRKGVTMVTVLKKT